MPGRAAVAMWWDIAAEARPEWEDWHTHEHMPERLGIPGFLRGSRWVAVAGDPSYFVLYEAARLATVSAGPYLERLNNPSPWSRRMMPHHRNMVRSLCRVRVSHGGGVGQAIATIRLSPARGKARSLTRWLGEIMPPLASRRGLAGAHLLHAQPMEAVPRTAEQEIRGGDATADWVLLVNGYDADALKALLANELNAQEFQRHGAAPGSVEGLYRLAFALTSKDLQR